MEDHVKFWMSYSFEFPFRRFLNGLLTLSVGHAVEWSSMKIRLCGLWN